MNAVPAPPRLTGGQVEVTRRQQLSVACPHCSHPIDITGLSVGTTIACSKCSNVTWTPEYIPRWWYKVGNFALSLIVAFIIGVISSMVAAKLLQRLEPKPTTPPAVSRQN